jgi:hypothetical protein
MREQSRGDRNIAWIENYCRFPGGPYQGRPVMLTTEEQQTVRAIYEGGHGAPVTGPMAAYIALLHVCGPEAPGRNPGPPCETDSWTVWRATSIDLKEVLTRRGELIICRELGTCYPAAA